MIAFLKRVCICIGYPILTICMLMTWINTTVIAVLAVALALPKWVLTGQDDLELVLKELVKVEEKIETELAYIFIGEEKDNWVE